MYLKCFPGTEIITDRWTFRDWLRFQSTSTCKIVLEGTVLFYRALFVNHSVLFYLFVKPVVFYGEMFLKHILFVLQRTVCKYIVLFFTVCKS